MVFLRYQLFIEKVFPQTSSKKVVNPYHNSAFEPESSNSYHYLDFLKLITRISNYHYQYLLLQKKTFSRNKGQKMYP